MELRNAKNPEEQKKLFKVIHELRPHLDWDNFQTLYQKAKEADQYTLVGVWDNGECLGAMGFRMLYDFVHGQHLYIDDLVVTESQRSRGVGAQLLKFAEKVAFEMGCQKMRLCTGMDNESGKRFYEREGWALRAIVYKKEITPPTLFVVGPTEVV